MSPETSVSESEASRSRFRAFLKRHLAEMLVALNVSCLLAAGTYLYSSVEQLDRLGERMWALHDPEIGSLLKENALEGLRAEFGVAAAPPTENHEVLFIATSPYGEHRIAAGEVSMPQGDLVEAWKHCMHNFPQSAGACPEIQELSDDSAVPAHSPPWKVEILSVATDRNDVQIIEGVAYKSDDSWTIDFAHPESERWFRATLPAAAFAAMTTGPEALAFLRNQSPPVRAAIREQNPDLVNFR